YVDYMEGRLTGIYKQNYVKQQQQQQSSSKYRTYFDTFYGTTRSVNNASSFFSSSFPYPYSNPFVMPYMRPSFRSNSYSDQSYKGMKPSSSSASISAPPQDLLSQMTTEYCREFARELARKAASAITTTTTTIPGSNLQSSIIQGGRGNNHILGVQHKQQQQQEDVFGYRFEICKDCLSMEPLQVKFGKDGTKDNNSNRNSNNNNNGPVDDVVARIEQKHLCDPKLVAANRKEVRDKEGSVKTMVDNLPKIASMITQGWSENQKNRISLIAVKIPHKIKNKNNDHEDNNDNIADNNNYNNNNNTIQPQQDTIIIPNPKNPKQQITFQYSQEKHINLSLISNETSKNHYAARAIKYGHTILTNEEMEDFLNMVQTSTFAIFETHESLPITTATASSLQPSLQQHHQHQQQQDESIGLYFLAIIPYDDTLYLQSSLPNKSNSNNNSNNNNNNKSIQSDSANEDFLSLCNHLDNISNFAIPMNSQRSSSSSS
ncbi:MAG TPA: hypothetical protein VE619_11705, partial [Nitrososphaeraceae archaeon]|nr:hypothetical protein [Nitrososphaeraceae archaeon]